MRPRLQELLLNEADHRFVFDLKQFLARIEGVAVRIVSCPEYVRSWIAAERSTRELEDKEPRL